MLEYRERRSRRVQVASKVILGPDIRVQMVRAVADVISGLRFRRSPKALIRRARSRRQCDQGWIRLITTMNS